MAGVQRRGLHIPRNEENMVSKGTKNLASRMNGTRTALSNISNIQRRPNLGTKGKKETFSVYEEKAPVQKPVGRVKSKKEIVDDILPEDEASDVRCISPRILNVEDIDEDDWGNPTLCAEYAKDIYRYMHKREKELLPRDYMCKQQEINQKMRSILVDWLVQVQSRFNLLQETLYLTIYIIDRFLDKHDAKRCELQLVGVTAMFLASKYEEMFAPEIGDFVYITDNAYCKAKIKSMEQKMMKVIDYDFSNPLCLQFLRRNSKAGSVDAKKHTLAKYLMEITLIDYNFTTRLPSQIAAAALYLSIKLIDNSEWTPTLEHYSGYSEEDIVPIVADMAALLLSMDTSKYQAVKTKYSASKFLRISRLSELKGEQIKSFAVLACCST